MERNYKSDTIAAISTAKGVGAIAVIRLSGEDSFKILKKVFNKDISKEKTHTLHFGKIRSGQDIVDEVLVSIFKAPKSFTGEDVIEISCHGNYFIANQILELLINNGARLAERGEFTKRAFLNSKLDLTQAESIGDLLTAKTRHSHEAALSQMEGKLYSKIERNLKKISNKVMQFEMEIDFIEDDLEGMNVPKILEELKILNEDLNKIYSEGKEGLLIKEGLKVALVGSPNVGKSSIFNAFLKQERAIVTPIAGTTRDYIEESVSIDGYYVRFFDTAGIRNTDDKIEKIGIERSENIIKKADLICYITTKENDIELELEKLKKLSHSKKLIKVLNKSDLLSSSEKKEFSDFTLCSTFEETGLKDLEMKILDYFSINEDVINDGIITNTRQLSALKNCIENLEKAIDSLENALGVEFTAFELKTASGFLEEIIGQISTDDILNRIFENFCIGK